MSMLSASQQQLGARLRGLRLRQNINNTVLYTVLTILSLIFLAPFLWLVSTALKSPADMGSSPIVWWPSVPQWQNFVHALFPYNFDYFRDLRNSLTLSLISMVLTTGSSALVGFGFARLKGVGKSFLFLIMLSTIMLPSIMTIIPIYVIYARLGIVGTYWPWIIGGLASSPFLSFLFRQFFSAIPAELEEAAIVDGCGYGRIFWQIFLPLSKPVLATAAILTFTGAWSDYLGPLIFLNADNTTLAVDLSSGYTDLHGHIFGNWLAAGSILYILPMLILFFFAQRYFIRGIVTTGLKG